MNYVRFVPLCALLSALTVTSCSSLKVSSWIDPQATDYVMGKTLVMGVTSSESLRREYEDAFAASLTERGVEATVSLSVLPEPERLTKEELTAKVQALGADSVLVTRVIGERDRVTYEAPMAYPGYYGNYHGYYSMSFSALHAPGVVRNYVETDLETNLYNAKTGALVWSGRKQIIDDRSEKRNMAAIIKAVVKDLAKRGLL